MFLQLVSKSLTATGVEKEGKALQSPTLLFLTGGVSGDLHTKVGERLYSYFADPVRWEVFPDTKKSLEKIKMAGLKLGAISNFDERLGLSMIHASSSYVFAATEILYFPIQVEFYLVWELQHTLILCSRLTKLALQNQIQSENELHLHGTYMQLIFMHFRLFQLALQKADVMASSALHVGDSYVSQLCNFYLYFLTLR